MQIQVTTDNNINGSAKLIENVSSELEAVLARFGTQLTRVDVHLRDTNGPKAVGDDKSCLLEARLAGRQPTVVSLEAATVRQAIDGATEKLERALDHIVDKQNNHKGRPSFGEGDGEAEV